MKYENLINHIDYRTRKSSVPFLFPAILVALIFMKGVACYDKELIEKIAEETGFAQDFVKKRRKPVWKAVLPICSWNGGQWLINRRLPLDTGEIGIDKCIDIIVDIAEKRCTLTSVKSKRCLLLNSKQIFS